MWNGQNTSNKQGAKTTTGRFVEISGDIKDYLDWDVYFFSPKSERYVLYKPKGVGIDEIRLKKKSMPERLYVSLTNKVEHVSNRQQLINRILKQTLKRDPARSKQLLTGILEAGTTVPIEKILNNMKNTVDLVLDDYLADHGIVKRLIEVTTKDYSTSVHSVNVMLYCLGYGRLCKFTYKNLKLFGLMGLLHDVGKVRVPQGILTAPRRLTEDEFEEIKKHTLYGYEMLEQCGLDSRVRFGALQHHERLDGSGYPNNITARDILPESMALAIIDIYEALTNLRPYKSPFPLLEGLDIIKKEVMDGKLDLETFKNFALSLSQV